MYSLVQGIYDSYLAPSQLNLLIVGAPGVGKTALLERLKVTQIPKRPSNQRRGSTLVVSTVDELTPQLKDEFIKGGAIENEISSSAINVGGGDSGNVVINNNNQELLLEMNNIRSNQSQQQQQQLQHYYSSSSSSSKPTTITQQQQQNWVDNHNNNGHHHHHHHRYVNNNRKKMISTVPASPVVITQTNRKNRIFNAICPAPERYKAAATAEDDDEDFVFDDDLNDLPPDNPDTTTTNSNNKEKEEEEEGFGEDFNIPIGESASSSSAPQAPGSTTPVVAPRRVRCHSKEMFVDHLDLPTPGGGSTKSTTTNNNNNNNNHQQEDGYDQYVYNEGFRSGSMEEIPITPASATETPPPTPASSTVDASAAMDNMPTTTRGASKGGVVPLPQLSTATTTTTTSSATATATETLQQSSTEEYDMKPNVKMLPLTKMRPTIGTNLGKIDIFGAKCNIFDVGGKMRKLWERYYGDCDAVIFCWKLGDDDDAADNGDDDSDSDEEDDTAEQQSKQQEILNEVRSAISDDIPFLIFGHVFGHANTQLVDKQYSTNLIMPHYHNPLCGLQVGCAKSGAGIVSAMEWLIPLAKRQQKERLARKQQQMSSTDDDEKQV